MPTIRQFRFFSERVFGAWVTAYVRKVGRKYVTVEALFHGNKWTERIAYGTQVFTDPGGDSFALTKEAVS
jgi:hypothetical protein